MKKILMLVIVLSGNYVTEVASQTPGSEAIANMLYEGRTCRMTDGGRQCDYTLDSDMHFTILGDAMVPAMSIDYVRRNANFSFGIIDKCIRISRRSDDETAYIGLVTTDVYVDSVVCVIENS